MDSDEWGGDWLPVGEEPLPGGNITDCIIQRHNGLSVVALPNGDIDADQHPSTGLYFQDSRYLSRLTFSLGGVAASLLDDAKSGAVHSAIFTNPTLQAPGGGIVPARALVLRRRRVIASALAETLTVSNYSSRLARVEIRYEVDADFCDIFQVRGFEWEGRESSPWREVDSSALTFHYDGTDGRRRTTRVQFSPEPSRISALGAVFEVALAPHETHTIELHAFPEEKTPPASFEAALLEMNQAEAAFTASMTQIQTDNDVVNDALRQSLLDLGSLTTVVDGYEYTAAGVPWFDTVFGRDSLIAGMFMLPYTHHVLGHSLRTLGTKQATEANPATDAAPGKIPHELRWGELARAGVVPFGQYYGSIDSTPLWLMALGEYFAWTGDRELVEELSEVAARAMSWCMTAMSSDGLLRYQRNSKAGLENQAWKDSSDAVAHLDGHLAPSPIALVEVQAYLVAALQTYVALGTRMGWDIPADVRPLLDTSRRALKRMRDPDTGYLFGIDAEGTAIATPVSNAAHVLWAGVADEQAAADAVRCLMTPDMFSGWGIRTMSRRAVAYNPLGYHTGSVWPHDNAIAVGGMRRYGHDQEALRLAEAFIDAALTFPDYQVPELYSGDERELRLVPTPYPVASRPQAWSAASLPYVFMCLLGLRPTASGDLTVTRPILPRHCREVEVRGLRCGGGEVDLLFRKLGDRTAVQVERVTGDLNIIWTNSWGQ